MAFQTKLNQYKPNLKENKNKESDDWENEWEKTLQELDNLPKEN